MARGFKDSDGKFRPFGIGSRSSRSNPKLHDNSLQVGVDGSQIAKLIGKQAKDFANKKTEEALQRISDTKERQARELQIRRDFEKRLISSFKRSRLLQIKDPVLLKNQILIDVPEVKDTKENIKFIENILNGFIKREKQKDKAIKKAKTQEEKDRIEAQFDQAELLEEKDVQKQLSKGDDKLKKKQAEKLAKLEAKDKGRVQNEKEIADKAVAEFKKKDEQLDKDEKASKLAKEEADKAVVTFADLEKTSKDDKKITDSFKDLLNIQKDAIKKQDVVETKTEEVEEAREVAETFVEDLGTSFPPEIITGVEEKPTEIIAGVT